MTQEEIKKGYQICGLGILLGLASINPLLVAAGLGMSAVLWFCELFNKLRYSHWTNNVILEDIMLSNDENSFRSWNLLQEDEQAEILKRFGPFSITSYLWKYDSENDEWIHVDPWLNIKLIYLEETQMHNLNAIMEYGNQLYRLLYMLDLPESEVKYIQQELSTLIKDALARNGKTVVEDYTPRI